MVEIQMRLAATATANFGYTVWVNAGEPDLTDLDPVDQTKKTKVTSNASLTYLNKGSWLIQRVKKSFKFWR